MRTATKGLRHPLHPWLVHFPIGLFVISFLLEVVNWFVPETGLSHVVFYAMAAGIGTALVAAVPGFIDYADIRKDNPAKRVGLVHMGLNLALVALYAVNLGLRYSKLAAAETPLVPFVMSAAGIGLLALSGYFGGVMVYDHGIGVGRHRRLTKTPERTLTATGGAQSDDLVPVAPESALREGETLRVDVQGQVLCVAKSAGQLFAFQEFCPHRFGPLSEGALSDTRVQCPWHRSVFDMATGKVLEGPAKENLRVFRVEVRDGQICVGPRPRSTEGAREEARDMAA